MSGYGYCYYFSSQAEYDTFRTYKIRVLQINHLVAGGIR